MLKMTWLLVLVHVSHVHTLLHGHLTAWLHCFTRLINWISYHLSNFQFRWSWEDWAEAAAATDLDAPKPFFIREVFQKCMRLSYHQRMVEIVPESFQPLLPRPPKSVYKFEGEGSGETWSNALGSFSLL